MTKEKAITIIESHKAHWQRLLREKICDETEGRETIEGFDMAISALSAEGNLISRRAVLDRTVNRNSIWNKITNAEGKGLEEIVNDLPTYSIPDSAENKGEWIMPIQDDGMSDPYYYQVCCSRCGFDIDPQTWDEVLHQFNADNYCPNCGAKMKGCE